MRVHGRGVQRQPVRGDAVATEEHSPTSFLAPTACRPTPAFLHLPNPPSAMAPSLFQSSRAKMCGCTGEHTGEHQIRLLLYLDGIDRSRREVDDASMALINHLGA